VSNRPAFSAHVDQSSGGLELSLSAAALGLLGWWLDRRLGTTPVLLIVLSLAGFIGSGLSLYYRYTARISQLREELSAERAAAEVATRARAEGSAPPTPPSTSGGLSAPGGDAVGAGP
jgi:hypothetical protein